VIRIALANLRFPSTPEESVALAIAAIRQAAQAQAHIVCFPECYIPGLRGVGKPVAPPDAAFLDQAHAEIAQSAAHSNITVILGTERIVEGALRATALVVNPDGSRAGFQDKVQIDPTEEGIYTPGATRQIFQAGPLTFGIAICHEGWRYPETVRWSARRGAHIVFHPNFLEAAPAPTFHENAIPCRAAENTIYFASVNYASPASLTTSTVARPDGTLQALHPRGQEGLLIAGIDLTQATARLASRYKPTE
jgi:predicted amidohydrolase